MAAPRATQFIALRNLSRSSQHVRKLHMLAPTARASPAVKRQLPDLTAESNSRQFGTTQKFNAARDDSTIDFFYFPDIDHDADPAANMIRVPILPDNYNPPRTGAHAPEAETIVHKPEINTMSLDSVYLPLAESHDGHALGLDLHAMADRVAATVRNQKTTVEEQASMMKQLWNDMVDDVFKMGKKMAA